MTTDEDLRDTLAGWLKDRTTNDAMPALGDRVGLEIVPDEEGMSKRQRARKSLDPLPRKRLAEIARDFGREVDAFGLEDLGLRVLEEVAAPISEITRRDVARCFGDDLAGERDTATLVGSLFSLTGSMDFSFLNTQTLADEITQHMTLNPGDWSVEYLFERIGALSCPIDRFGRLLEAALHPLARRGPDQPLLVAQLNEVLLRDGYRFAPADEESGHPIYRLTPVSGGVSGAPKNLIFASTGPKPEIGLKDAVNNDIVILSNADSCLVYERRIPRDGLTWTEMVKWWGETGGDVAPDPAKALGKRLFGSLASDGERNLFRCYFRHYREALGDGLPALIPQVYLHYDPAVVKRLTRRDGMFRQRMDFLLLLPNAHRIVLEVDGSQHFAVEGKASLTLYSQMAAADRELRLLGYEVYRFGANELVGPGANAVVTTFFDGLWRRYGLAPTASRSI